MREGETSDKASARARRGLYLRWCGRSVAAAAVLNGLASGFVFSYFERSALCGGW